MGVGGSYDGLCIAVGERLRKSLADEILKDGGVDGGHLGVAWREEVLEGHISRLVDWHRTSTRCGIKDSTQPRDKTIAGDKANLHEKITKGALAGSFDDSEAAKRTRFSELIECCWEVY